MKNLKNFLWSLSERSMFISLLIAIAGAIAIFLTEETWVFGATIYLACIFGFSGLYMDNYDCCLDYWIRAGLETVGVTVLIAISHFWVVPKMGIAFEEGVRWRILMNIVEAGVPMAMVVFAILGFGVIALFTCFVMEAINNIAKPIK